jgi:deoxycytidylate deaminase
MYHCKKQIVIAIIITKNNKVHIGYNDCENNVDECPRKDRSTGEGYELCRTMCKQNSHAEISAINKCEDKLELKDATLILKGHSYVCDGCKKQLLNVGIKNWKII